MIGLGEPEDFRRCSPSQMESRVDRRGLGAEEHGSASYVSRKEGIGRYDNDS